MAAGEPSTDSAPARSHVVAHEPPTVTWELDHPAPRYYNWRETFPFLRVMLEHREKIAEEMAAAIATRRWHDWPERNLYKPDAGDQWRVFPFCYTIPSWDESKTVWVTPSLEACPFTAGLLASLPGIRTALFSHMGPHTRLVGHQGWADLANYVLRCHMPLVVPAGGLCGMTVEGETQLHKLGDILVFDDSKTHLAYNASGEFRTILLFDIVRPEGCPLGGAVGATTDELEGFIDYFK